MSLLNEFRAVKCFAFDVDGVLTDGSVLLMDTGGMLRTMNTKDGYALQLAVKKGYPVIVISGGASEGARQRLNKLGILEADLQVHDKMQVLDDFLQQQQLTAADVLYMGDDIPDYLVMKTAGLPCCPSDAVPEIKRISRYIARMPGGKGCVREVIEKVLKLNGHWDMDTTVAAK